VAARAILTTRGNAPRLYQNALVFLAADKTRLQDLDEAARRYLAWESIVTEREVLNLDPHQAKQAETQQKAADDAVTARIPETYQWLLVPTQATPQSPVELSAMRLTGTDALAVRASRKLKNDELLIVEFAPTMLRKAMDDVPLWRGDHVAVKQLIEDFAKYLYLPRLRGPEVLVDAVQEGVGRLTWRSETFALADSWDDKKAVYLGLRAGQASRISADSGGLLVKPDVAAAQIDQKPKPALPPLEPGEDDPNRPVSPVSPIPEPPRRLMHRFHGSVSLDPDRLGRDAGRIAEEIVQHLSTQKNATVRLTLEIEADLPEGAPDNVVRIVTENARTLKFRSQGFEEE
jgi:hypothetical protein